MPKQKGIIKLKGTLNGVCYYPLKGMYIKRKATGPSRERIYNDPAFKTLRQTPKSSVGLLSSQKPSEPVFWKQPNSFRTPQCLVALQAPVTISSKRGVGSLEKGKPTWQTTHKPSQVSNSTKNWLWIIYIRQNQSLPVKKTDGS